MVLLPINYNVWSNGFPIPTPVELNELAFTTFVEIHS